MNDFDLRLNSPVVSERVSGELLYSQLRARPLTSDVVSDMAFYEENTDMNTDQAWVAPLNDSEATAVASYTSRQARWLDVMCARPAVAASALGMAQYTRLEQFDTALRSAVSKSLTHSLLLRHYVRDVPVPPPGQPPLKGRVYVLRSYMSCSLVSRDDPGYGATEVRMVVPAGAGRGLFVSPYGSSLKDSEFLLPPGSTFRIVAGRRGLLMAELVRPLSLSWSERAPQVVPSRCVCESVTVTEGNRDMIESCRGDPCVGLLPDVTPAPTAGW